MSKSKVIISSCLLGHTCRYDGKTKKTTEVVDAFEGFEIIPFCPEAPLFGTPRERISVVEIDGNHRIITDKSNKDVTKLLEDEINSFIKLHPEADKIVLKSKSPSCGIGTTTILNEQKVRVKLGDGIAGSIFKNKYSGVEILNENVFS